MRRGTDGTDAMTDTSQSLDEAGQEMPAGWEGILAADEHILWQGRPDQGFHIGWLQVPLAAFGLFFAGFALFWMVMASQAGGIFWMFGLLHFGVGLSIVFSATLLETITRRGTWYTLTDRNAFIATDLPFKGRNLETYPITPDTRLTLRDGAPGSVIFGAKLKRGNNGSRSVDVGFNRIDDAGHVYHLMRKAQRHVSTESQT